MTVRSGSSTAWDAAPRRSASYPVVWHGMTIDVTHRLERAEHPPTVDAAEPGSTAV